MRVIPVGAALAQLEPVEKAFARRDAVETEAGHAIHPERQDDAVPVDRGGHTQAVGHAQVHRGALLPAQQRAGHAAVDGGRGPRHPGEVDGGLDDVQRKIGAAERGGLAGAGQRPGIRGTQQTETGRRTAQGQALHEAPPRQIGRGRRGKWIHVGILRRRHRQSMPVTGRLHVRRRAGVNALSRCTGSAGRRSQRHCVRNAGRGREGGKITPGFRRHRNQPGHGKRRQDAAAYRRTVGRAHRAMHVAILAAAATGLIRHGVAAMAGELGDGRCGSGLKHVASHPARHAVHRRQREDQPRQPCHRPEGRQACGMA